MLRWPKSLFAMPEPAGPSQTIRTFSPRERTITQDAVRLGGCATPPAGVRQPSRFLEDVVDNSA